jgi:hypothetical protein
MTTPGFTSVRMGRRDQSTGVDVIDLERHHGAAGGGGQLAPARAAEDDLLAVEEVGDRLRGREGGVGEHDAADLLSGEQAQALGLVKLDQFDRSRSFSCGCHCCPRLVDHVRPSTMLCRRQADQGRRSLPPESNLRDCGVRSGSGV